MHLTKSLFVEFCTSPKLARRHINDKNTYKAINESLYSAMDGLAVGQATEDIVLQYYQQKNKTIATVGTNAIDFRNWHQSYHQLTQAVFQHRPEILYQGAFCMEDVFTKSDFLVRNDEGTYDLVEVKSKNSIRKDTKAKPLIEELLNDASFQHYVLSNVLGSVFSGKVYLAYLNKEYVKLGDIFPQGLLILEEVSGELLSHEQIGSTLGLMRKNLSLPLDEFTKLYPYKGEDYMTYFGHPEPKDSIWHIPRIGKKVMSFYPERTKLADLTEEDVLNLYTDKGEKTNTSKFVELRRQGETVIDAKEIQKIFASELTYPLYFYDYETLTRPIPILEGTSPRQQVIVQYSLHKIDADGTITYKEAIVQPGEKDNKRIIAQLIQDFEDSNGTYIVRYKGFENTRNTETGETYPEYREMFEKVNRQTFDLMEIFSKFLYFDRRFQGSASIKKVLPVLTDITYEGMNVPNGSVATDLLRQIAQGTLPQTEAKKVTDDLLTYCEQDTRAMVRIWEEVKKKI